MITISLAISHTPWVEERVRTLDRLECDLGLARAHWKCSHFRRFEDRAPNWIWSAQMWSWSAETDASHCLFLQDDAMVAPYFWNALCAMLEAVPDQIIGLEAVHPAGRSLARRGGRWYTTADGLIGVGYVLPRETLKEFLRWRLDALHAGAVEQITEDTLIDVFAIATGRKIWHPVPTIIDHDVAVDSTYGNDAHTHRRPTVLWSDGDVCGWKDSDLEKKDFWMVAPVPHLGRFYAGTHFLAKQHVKRFSEADRVLVDKDTCPPEYARWF